MPNMTLQSYLAHQAKFPVAGRQSPEAPQVATGCDQESELHYDIIAYCKSRGWIYFHGSMALKTTRTLGEPDFTILADQGRVFFVECKTKKGKLSIEQRGLQIMAAGLGHTIHVCRSLAEFVAVTESQEARQPQPPPAEPALPSE